MLNRLKSLKKQVIKQTFTQMFQFQKLDVQPEISQPTTIRKKTPGGFLINYEIKALDPIMGPGIVTLQDIKKGEIVYRYNMNFMVRFNSYIELKNYLSQLDIDQTIFVIEHIFTAQQSAFALRDDSNYFNHHKDANTQSDFQDKNPDNWFMKAKENIYKGQELTENYLTFDKVQFMEDVCDEYNLPQAKFNAPFIMKGQETLLQKKE